jgi:hypothetical protein
MTSSVLVILYEGILHLVLFTALLVISLFLFGDALLKIAELISKSVYFVRRLLAFEKRIR